MSLEVFIAEESLRLLPERALYWPRRRTLLLSDLHLGKDQVFRDHGIPIPASVLQEDLSRLEHLISEYKPHRLIILGDLVHTRPRALDRWVQRFQHWRGRYGALQIDVVLGNHDRGMEDIVDQWNMVPHQQIVEAPFCFVHDPRGEHPGYPIGGHVHPTLKLQDGPATLRVPVFWVRTDSTILPAFGVFTGGHDIRPDPTDRLFAVAGNEVVETTPIKPGDRL